VKRLVSPFALLLLVCAPYGVLADTASPGPPPDPTLHLFRESPDGGIVAVSGDHGVSREFIAHIRSRLHKDAIAYAMGDYPNPDGHTASVAKLRAGAGRIRVTYSDVPRGGEIILRTSDTRLVDALHDWMAATVRLNQKLHRDGGPGNYPLNDRND
jgi:hypothetical protein